MQVNYRRQIIIVGMLFWSTWCLAHDDLCQIALSQHSNTHLCVKASEWNRHAQYRLGQLYYQDYRKSKYSDSLQQAIYLFREAAAQGFGPAEERVGYAYLEGLGVQQNPVKANIWLSKAAKSGNHHAQWLLGYAYEQGIGCKQSYTLAKRWYRQALNGYRLHPHSRVYKQLQWHLHFVETKLHLRQTITK